MILVLQYTYISPYTTLFRSSLVGGGRHAADASGGDASFSLQTDLALGIEGSRARARHLLEHGEKAFCSLSWARDRRSEEHTSELQSRQYLVCRLMLYKKI